MNSAFKIRYSRSLRHIMQGFKHPGPNFIHGLQKEKNMPFISLGRE